MSGGAARDEIKALIDYGMDDQLMKPSDSMSQGENFNACDLRLIEWIDGFIHTYIDFQGDPVSF